MKTEITDAHLKACRRNPPAGGRLDFDTKMRGFAVRVTAKGQISFLLCYVIDGIERRYPLGRYTGEIGGMTVKAARERAAQVRHEVDTGVDPMAKRVESAKEIRFETLTERYLDEWAKPKKKSWKEDDRRIRKYLLPVWNERKVSTIERSDVIALVAPIKRKVPIEANRVLALISGIFSFAVDNEIVKHHPALRMKTLKSKERKRERALTTAKELRVFWRVTAGKGVWGRIIRKREGDCLRMIALCGGRRSEVAGMEWAEFDFAEMLWTLPAERSKNGLPLTLPITDAMMTILQPLIDAEAKKDQTKRNRWVFQGPRKSPCDAKKLARKLNQVCERLARIGIDSFTCHDLRRTVETGMAAARVPKEWRDRVLNHKDTSVGGTHYNMYDYLDEKQEALDKWAKRLERLLTEDTANNVVQFRRVA